MPHTVVKILNMNKNFYFPFDNAYFFDDFDNINLEAIPKKNMRNLNKNLSLSIPIIQIDVSGS